MMSALKFEEVHMNSLKIKLCLVLLAGIALTGFNGILPAQNVYNTDLGYVVPKPTRLDSLANILSNDRKKMDIRLMPLLDAEYLADDITIEAYKQNLEDEKQFIPAGEADFPEGSGAGDMVYVYVDFGNGGSDKTIESLVRLITDYDNKNNYAVAWIETANLDAVVALKKVDAVYLAAKHLIRTGTAALTQGDAIHQTDDVRSIYGQLGAGIKIGVISDGVDHRSASQATGDLPNDGAGLTVLGNTVGGDEGTAMLEIIYDMVPSAELVFHDCGNNTAAFNSAVDELIGAGCDIICDGIGWITQPFFEDGTVASHISSALRSNDLIYVSSAGNSAGEHYQGDYLAISGSTQHDFSNGVPGSGYYQYIHMENGDNARVVLQWNDAFGSSGNDYNLYLFNLNTRKTVAWSANVQDGNDNPLEFISYTSNSTADFAIVVNKTSIAAAKTLEVYSYPSGGAYLYSNNVVAANSIFGHPAVTGVIAAGAISAGDSGNDSIELFSSQGPSTISFPALETRSKPDLCGIDGVSIAGAGGFSNPFYGTSASAPHVAAIAAQLWGQFPRRSGDQILEMVKATAVDLGSAGADYVFGSGRADALNAFFTYVQSEIGIQRPLGTLVIDGGTSGAGSIPTGSVSMTFSVINSGTFALGVSSVTALNLVNSSAFTVVTPLPLSVAAGDTGDLTVSFNVDAAGAFSMDMDIVSNDADENPYDIAVSGIGLAPEIDIQRPLVTSIADGGTADAGTPPVGNVSMSFSVINSGALPLNVTGVTAANFINSSSFIITTPLPLSIAAVDTADLTVSFNVDVAGSFGMDLDIMSNDADESPYDIAVFGTGLAPEINIQSPLGTPVADGGTMDAGTPPVGSVSLTFSVINSGALPLSVSGVTSVNLVNSSSFTVLTPMPLNITAVDTRDLIVSFNVDAAGAFSMDLDIANNDADESPYDISVTGTGIAPEIMIQRPLETSIVDGGTDNVGNKTIGAVSLSYSIINSGGLPLNVSGVTASNLTNASSFSVVTTMPLNIAAGDTADLAVSFNVGAAGAFSLDMDIVGNDTDENPYDIAISGTGVNPSIYAKVKVFLEGPYQVGGSMRTSLKTAGYIPLTSPYADARTVTAVPAGVTDWISVELRSIATGPSLKQKSFFLSSNGYIVDTDGITTDLKMLDLVDGNYYIVLRHRNHLAVMSANAQQLISASAQVYDFTTASTQFYGTGGAKELETGRWGMFTGNANNANNGINVLDLSGVKLKFSQVGYLNADTNMNGGVNVLDFSRTKTNLGKSAKVP